MKAFIYILQFDKSGRFYVGSTTNKDRRLKQHAAGHTASTKTLGSFKLVFRQAFADSATAKSMERKIKNWKRRDFIKKIIADGKMKAV